MNDKQEKDSQESFFAALSLACNVIRAVVELIRFSRDKKRAATTPNSDGSGAEKHQ